MISLHSNIPECTDSVRQQQSILFFSSQSTLASYSPHKHRFPYHSIKSSPKPFQRLCGAISWLLCHSGGSRARIASKNHLHGFPLTPQNLPDLSVFSGYFTRLPKKSPHRKAPIIVLKCRKHIIFHPELRKNSVFHT